MRRCSHRIAALLLLLPAARAAATETRTSTLRSVGGVVDETDVLRYPGAAPFHDVALVELGFVDDVGAYGGALKRLGSVSVGAIVSRDDSLFTRDALGDTSLVATYLEKTASNDATDAVLPEPERPVDLFFGLATGASSAFGLRLTTASFRDESKTSTGPRSADTRRADQLDLTAGYTILAPARIDLSLSLGLMGTLKSQQEAPGSKIVHKYRRGNELSLGGRWIAAGGGAGKPYGEAVIGQRSPKVSSTVNGKDDDAKFAEKVISLEGGYLLTPAAGTTVAMGLGAVMLDSKGPVVTTGTGIGTDKVAVPSHLASDDRVTKETKLIYASLATEAPVGAGVGLMGGLRYSLWGTVKTKDDFNQGQPRSEESVAETPDSALWALGLFYEAQALRADASFSKAFLHRGPYAVTGHTTENVFGRISVSYKI
jgi:hypothetical protein